jgi:hypothetical protein
VLCTVRDLFLFLLIFFTTDDVLIHSLSFLAKIISLEMDGVAPFAESFSLPDHMMSIIEAMTQLGVAKADPIVSTQLWRAGVDGVSVLSVVMQHRKDKCTNAGEMPSDV